MKAILLLMVLVVTMAGSARAQAGAPAGGRLLSEAAYGKIVKCALRDRAGNLWFATNWAGVYRFDGHSFTHFSTADGLPSDRVNVIREDRDGVLWFGTESGVARFEGRTFSRLDLPAAPAATDFLNPGRAPVVAVPNVTSIAEDQAGHLWFGLWGPPGSAGAWRYDGKAFTRFQPEKPTQGIVVDDTGGVWLNSRRYDGRAFEDFSDREHAFQEAVFCSLKDRGGHLWFGVREDGLYRYDGKDFAWFPKEAGTFERVTCIFEDSAGRLWLGGDIRHGTDKGGLCYYDGKAFVQFPQVYDLGMYSVWAAAEDQAGNVWFAGRGGKLLRYDGKTFTDFSGALD